MRLNDPDHKHRALLHLPAEGINEAEVLIPPFLECKAELWYSSRTNKQHIIRVSQYQHVLDKFTANESNVSVKTHNNRAASQQGINFIDVLSVQVLHNSKQHLLSGSCTTIHNKLNSSNVLIPSANTLINILVPTTTKQNNFQYLKFAERKQVLPRKLCFRALLTLFCQRLLSAEF